MVRKFNEESSLKDLLKHARSLVRRFNTSTKANEKLVRKLVHDCCTSMYLMINRLLLVKAALSQVLQELEWDDLAISEWKSLESIRDLLHPFAMYTSLISGEDFTTISAVLPSIMDLNLHLEEVFC